VKINVSSERNKIKVIKLAKNKVSKRYIQGKNGFC